MSRAELRRFCENISPECHHVLVLHAPLGFQSPASGAAALFLTISKNCLPPIGREPGAKVTHFLVVEASLKAKEQEAAICKPDRNALMGCFDFQAGP